MAIGRTNAMVVSTTPSTTDPYKGQRPSNWLAVKLPSQMKAEKPNNFQCEILVELTDYGLSNICFAYKGNYTVDWGDGTQEELIWDSTTLKKQLIVQHYYNYDNITNSLTTNSKQVLVKIVAADNDTTTNKLFSLDLADSWTSTNDRTEYGRNNYTVEPYLEISCYCPTTYFTRLNIVGGGTFSRVKFLSVNSNETPNFYSQWSGILLKCAYLHSLVSFPEFGNVNLGPFSYEDSSGNVTWNLIDTFSEMYCFSDDFGNYLINTSKLSECNNLYYAFYENKALSKLPDLLTFANVIRGDNAFDGCIGISDFHTNTFTNTLKRMDYMFRNSGIKVCNDLETSNVTTMIEAFKNCRALTRLTLSLNSITSDSAIKDFVKGCYSLTHLTLTKTGGIDVALDLSDCTLLSANYLEALFNNLATITTAKTLTLGATLLAKLSDTQKAIATNKGWTLA